MALNLYADTAQRTFTAGLAAHSDYLLAGGGRPSHASPHTRTCKPMITFGAIYRLAIYRLIDIPLSNCVNSALRKINILTQDKP